MHFPHAVAAVALTAAFSTAQVAYHFEFDQPSILPYATPGVSVANNTGSATTAFFSVSCGLLQMDTTINPTLGAFFYGGTVGAYPPSGPGFVIGQPTFAEARFAFVGGTGGAGTIPDCTSVVGILNGVAVQLILNCVTGAIGLSTGGSGVAWATVPGGSGLYHDYRIETVAVGTATLGKLAIDGVTVLGPIPVPATTSNGWYIGDVAGSSSISATVYFDAFSTGQAPAGPGQANSPEAALFVNRANNTAVGMPGLRGPFVSTAPSGSVLTLEWNGFSNMPFAMFAGGQGPALFNLGCAGWIDLLGPWSLVFDPTAPFVGNLFVLDGCGYAKQTFVVPPLPPGFSLVNLQGFVFQPTSAACPFLLTAAHYVYG